MSPDIGKGADKCTFNFWIPVYSLMNGICHTSRTSNDIDMKLEPLTEPDERKTATLKKFDN